MKYFRYYINLVENEMSVTSNSFLNKIIKIVFEGPQKFTFTLIITQTLGFLQSHACLAIEQQWEKTTFGKIHSN